MTGETLIQQQTRLNQERYQQEQGKLGAFAGTVVFVSPTSDEVGMAFGPAAERRMPVQHPYVGENSWVRSMPEVGSLFLMQNRFDTGQPEAIKAIPTFSAQKADDFQSALNFYRPIQSGEHDIASSGQAFAFFGSRGHLDLRSGANIKVQLNRDEQDLTSAAPTHRRNFLYQTVGEMGDEERFGIIKRWTTASEEFYVKDGDNFVAEHYRHLKNPAKSGPAVLLKHTEGHVYDDDGEVIKHTTTALALRSQHLWYTTTDEFLAHEIDKDGNMLFNFPSTATTGMEVQIPQGSYRKVIGKDRDVSIDRDEKVSIQGLVAYQVGKDVTYDVTGSATWNSGGGQMKLDATDGSEAALLQNKAGFGIEATSAGGGALNITGPSDTSLKVESSGATTLTGKTKITITVDEIMNLEGSILNANFDSINLGKGAAIPAVLGMALQTFLDTHQHTTTAPGSPTSPANVPSASFNGTPLSVLSLKVMLSGNT